MKKMSTLRFLNVGLSLLFILVIMTTCTPKMQTHNSAENNKMTEEKKHLIRK